MNYFKDIGSGITTTVKGMIVTIRQFFHRPYTIQYPEQMPYFSPYERGFHEFEPEECIICELCAKACPVDCIYIEQEGRGKAATLTRYAIDYDKCLFCGLCLEPCPVDCIHMGGHYDLTAFEREKSMIVEFTHGEGPWRTILTSAAPGTGVRAHQPASARAGGPEGGKA
ncbi:MAG: NADH-quinone oxidoreductase subunit I [Planctomycetota bacterium]